MRKPTTCIGENKGADQLFSNCTADQRLCFRHTMSAIRIIVLTALSVACLTPESIIARQTKRRLNALEMTIDTLSESLDELVDPDNVTQAILYEMNSTIHELQRSIETLFSSQDSLINADEVIDARQNEMNSSIQDLKQELQVCSATVATLSDKLNSVLETVAVTQANLNRMNTSLAQHLAQERHAFQVLRSTNVTFKGYNFLALEVRVAADGLSRSPNWCYDYQYLCNDFNRRPTGCGSGYAYFSGFTSCRDKYNSDMSINGSVLSCYPSYRIAELANIAFPNLTPPAQYKNAFGFYRCDDCKRTLQASDLALTFMRGFWESNMTTFYTVCY